MLCGVLIGHPVRFLVFEQALLEIIYTNGEKFHYAFLRLRNLHTSSGAQAVFKTLVVGDGVMFNEAYDGEALLVNMHCLY